MRSVQIIITATMLFLTIRPLAADSFMSSSDLAGGVAEKKLPDRAATPLSAAQMLVVMDWKGLDPEYYELGGIRAPVKPNEALAWLADPRRELDPLRRFLAAYKAVWDVREKRTGASLLAEMQRCKAEYALANGSTADRQAAMALGIALATLQIEIFHVSCDTIVDEQGNVVGLAGANRNLWDRVTPVKLAAASAFAESVALTRSGKVGADHAALRHALRSAWKYAGAYPGVRAALVRFLKWEDVDWLK